VLDFTNHLSDRELYAIIARDILPSYEKKLDRRANYLHWDCASTSGDPETWLRFYASDDERDVWAEVLVDELGWVGFDVLDNTCPSAETVRVVVGLDVPGIAATRIGHYGNVGPFEQKTSIAVRLIGG